MDELITRLKLIIPAIVIIMAMTIDLVPDEWLGQQFKTYFFWGKVTIVWMLVIFGILVYLYAIKEVNFRGYSPNESIARGTYNQLQYLQTSLSFGHYRRYEGTTMDIHFNNVTVLNNQSEAIELHNQIVSYIPKWKAEDIELLLTFNETIRTGWYQAGLIDLPTWIRLVEEVKEAVGIKVDGLLTEYAKKPSVLSQMKNFIKQKFRFVEH